MKPETHLEKALRMTRSQEKLNPEEDWESIIEICYGAAQNFIADYCQRTFGEHLDTHKGLPGFLDEHDLKGIASLFRQLDHLRMAGWYGGRRNGDNAKAARDTLEKIRELCEGDEQEGPEADQ